MRSWWLISIGIMTLQCGGIAKTAGNDLCKPGERTACQCGRDEGVRVCAADGLDYGVCSCDHGGSGGGAGTTGTGNGGTSVGGSNGGGTDGSTGPVLCTSQRFWTQGTTGSTDMTPGEPCVACHSLNPKGTQLSLAGTIFQGPHDVNDCEGVDGTGHAVAILDETNPGMEIAPRLFVSSKGNFYTTKPLPSRYRVKIIAAGRDSFMQTPVTNGDCNFCHTAEGAAGAKGRLTDPPP